MSLPPAQLTLKISVLGLPLVVQWLRLHAATAGGCRLGPQLGNEDPTHCMVQPRKIIKNFLKVYPTLIGGKRAHTHTRYLLIRDFYFIPCLSR